MFLGKLLQPDGYGDPGAILLPADHDSDEKPETLELVLSEQQAWDLYRDDILMPHRESFLEETTSGQVISGHLSMVHYLGRWANLVRQFEGLTPLEREPAPDSHVVAVWAMENLGIDIENAYRASNYIDADDGAQATVMEAATKIDEAYSALQSVTLILMAVPQLQMGHEDQALHVEDQSDGTWRVKHIMGNGSLVITCTDKSSPYTRRRVVTAEELLEWNNLSFVPDQASGVHSPETT
jgi:hypothetical protein